MAVACNFVWLLRLSLLITLLNSRSRYHLRRNNSSNIHMMTSVLNRLLLILTHSCNSSMGSTRRLEEGRAAGVCDQGP